MTVGWAGNDNLVKDVLNVIHSTDLGWTLKQAVQDELSKSFVNVKDIKRLVPVRKINNNNNYHILIFFKISNNNYSILSHNPTNVLFLQVFMKEAGWDIKVRNVVFQHMLTHSPPAHPITPPESLKEPMIFIRTAQVSANHAVFVAIVGRRARS